MSGYTDISRELQASTSHFDHRVALSRRINARYRVEACNASGCSLSVLQLIEGTLDEAIGYFKASNTGSRDEFGATISLSADGKTMAVSSSDEASAATGVNGDQKDNSMPDADLWR